METIAKAKVTSKGQVTIPKEVRERLGIRFGDELEFVQDDTGLRVQKRLVESAFSKYRGYLRELAGHDPDALVEELRGPGL